MPVRCAFSSSPSFNSKEHGRASVATAMNTALGTWDMPVANKAPLKEGVNYGSGTANPNPASNSAGCLEYKATLRKKNVFGWIIM